VSRGTNNHIKLNVYFIFSPLSKQVDLLVTLLEHRLGRNCIMLLNRTIK